MHLALGYVRSIIHIILFLNSNTTMLQQNQTVSIHSRSFPYEEASRARGKKYLGHSSHQISLFSENRLRVTSRAESRARLLVTKHLCIALSIYTTLHKGTSRLVANINPRTSQVNNRNSA